MYMAEGIKSIYHVEGDYMQEWPLMQDGDRHIVGLQPLFNPIGRPDIVAREPYLLDPEDEDANRQVELLAEALFCLHDEYGLAFPGIANSVPSKVPAAEGEPNLVTYSETVFVEGKNMRRDMAAIPQEVTITTLSQILKYYQDAAADSSGRLYLPDLSLRQFIYGQRRLSEGGLDGDCQAYMIDIDSALTNKEKVLAFPNKRNPFRDGLIGLNGDILTLQRAFPAHSFDSEWGKLRAIAQGLNIEL